MQNPIILLKNGQASDHDLVFHSYKHSIYKPYINTTRNTFIIYIYICNTLLLRTCTRACITSTVKSWNLKNYKPNYKLQDKYKNSENPELQYNREREEGFDPHEHGDIGPPRIK